MNEGPKNWANLQADHEESGQAMLLKICNTLNLYLNIIMAKNMQNEKAIKGSLKNWSCKSCHAIISQKCEKI